MKILAVIIGRKNSKRLKNKHHLLIKNKKVINYTLDLLKNFKYFSKTIVSTDDKKIIQLIKKYPKFIPLERPSKLSKDKTKPIQVIRYVYRWHLKKFGKVDGIFVFQPTSPLRSKNTINKMLKIYKNFKTKRAVVSVSPVNEHPEWMLSIKKSKIKPLINYKSFIKRSQNCKKLHKINGLGYLLTPKDVLTGNTLIPQNSIPCECSSQFEAIDIDTFEDLIKARVYIHYLKYFQKKN